MQVKNILITFLLVVLVVAILSSGLIPTIIPAQGGLFLSENGGDAWSRADTVLGEGSVARRGVLDIVFNERDPRIVYIGTKGSGLYKSLEGGESWIKAEDKNNFLSESATVHSIALDPSRPDYFNNLQERLYLGVSQGGRGHIFKSENGALSFREVFITTPGDKAVSSLAVETLRPNRLWAGTEEGVLVRSDDFGETWGKINQFSGLINKILPNPTRIGEVFISTDNAGIFRTFNEGISWENLTPSIRGLGGSKVVSAARDPHRPSVIYLGTNNGVLRSVDSGTSWSRLNLVIPNDVRGAFDIAFSQDRSSIIHIAEGSLIFTSYDTGETWIVRDLPTKRQGNSIAVDPHNSVRVLVGMHKI